MHKTDADSSTPVKSDSDSGAPAHKGDTDNTPGAKTDADTAAPVKGGVPEPAGLPTDLSGFDWVFGVQAVTLKGLNDYVVRDRVSGGVYLYSGRKSGVSTPRLLGEGLVAYDLAG